MLNVCVCARTRREAKGLWLAAGPRVCEPIAMRYGGGSDECEQEGKIARGRERERSQTSQRRPHLNISFVHFTLYWLGYIPKGKHFPPPISTTTTIIQYPIALTHKMIYILQNTPSYTSCTEANGEQHKSQLVWGGFFYSKMAMLMMLVGGGRLKIQRNILKLPARWQIVRQVNKRTLFSAFVRGCSTLLGSVFFCLVWFVGGKCTILLFVMYEKCFVNGENISSILTKQQQQQRVCY